jgi:PIN domain nuclease of toxin-antitoxin system
MSRQLRRYAFPRSSRFSFPLPAAFQTFSTDISLFELARAFERERSHLGISVESALTEVERRFVVVPINSQISVRALGLPPTYPKDPADRIIGATALVEGIPLITADREIRKYRALTTIW